MSEKTLHVWKFPNSEPQVSIVDGPVSEVARRTMLKVKEHGYRVDRTGGTRTFGGEYVSLSYVSGDPGDREHQISHWFLRPSDAWSMVDASELTDVLS